MKKDEKFVADALVIFYTNNGIQLASYNEPKQDPPDMNLNLDGKIYPVEITKVDENSINQRTNYALGYRAFIQSILKKNSSKLPESISYVVSVQHSSTAVGKIKRKFKKFLDDIFVGGGFSKNEYIFSDGRVLIKFTKLSSTSKGQNFPMTFSNRQRRISNDIKEVLKSLSIPLDLNFETILRNCIVIKDKKCSKLTEPIWLALHDCYSNKFYSTETEQFSFYQSVICNIPEKSKFNCILVVLESGAVKELYRK